MSLLNYEESIKYSADWVKVVESTNTLEFAPLARVFSANIGRVGAMAQLPSQLHYFSLMMGICNGAAMERLGKFGNHEQSMEAKQLGNRFFTDWAVRRAQHDQIFVENESWSVGAGNFETMAASDSTMLLYEGMQSILSTMITTAWASFETLAIDLWIACVNKHPYPIALRAIK
jgi:hypothetical protein